MWVGKHFVFLSPYCVYSRALPTIVKRLFNILFIFISLQSFCQIDIKGTVFSSVDKEPLPGVNVTEYGKENKAITSIDGKYELHVSDSNSIITFDFIGLISDTIKIRTNTTIDVYLSPDSIALSEVIFGCYFPLRYTEIGYSSGVNYTPVGFKIKNQIPNIWRINLNLESSINYRKANDNEYIDLYLRRYNLFTLFNSGIGLIGEYRKFNIADNLSEEYTFAPTFPFKGLLWSIGYSRQYRKIGDINKTEVNGLYFGVTKSFPFGFSLSTNSQYLNDLWQFDIECSKHFYIPNLTLSMGYERLYKYDEFDFTLSYRINY